MDPTVLVDSNVYIDLLNRRLDPLMELGRRYAIEDIACCGVVKAEVLRGIRSPKQLDALQRFFAVTQMVPTTASLWDEAWQLAWKLDRQGKTLPLQDLVIACCAMRAGAVVLTGDKHFLQIPEIRVIGFE